MEGHDKVMLLDTHVLVWLTAEPEKLSKQASSALRRANRAGGLAISAITLWELAWLVTNGRLQVTGTVEAPIFERFFISNILLLPFPERYKTEIGHLPIPVADIFVQNYYTAALAAFVRLVSPILILHQHDVRGHVFL